MLLEILGNKNMVLAKRMLSVHSVAYRFIAQNASNSVTPNYRRYESKNSSKEALRQGSIEAYKNIETWVERPNTTPIRNNGNNVDVEKEVLDAKETKKLFDINIQVYNRLSEMESIAIQGGR